MSRARAVIMAMCVALLAAILGTAVTSPASAAPDSVRLDLRVLVVHDPSTQPFEDLMTRDGTPFDAVDISQAATINAGTLVDGAGTAKYQGVVVPNLSVGAGQAWRAALTSYEVTYGVRELASYVSPLGLSLFNQPPTEGSTDGKTLTVTANARAAGAPFSYLKGPVPFDTGSWGYQATLATPPAGVTVTQMATMGTATMLGVVANGGTETMFLTFNANIYQSHTKLLGPGILNWLTYGTHLGLNRSYLAVHADDVFSEDSRWSVTANCTPGDSVCTGVSTTDIMMTAADADQVRTWQTNNGIKIDMVYNAAPAVTRGDAGTAGSMTKTLLDNKASYRWINHTYSHAYLGCARGADFNCLTQNPSPADPGNPNLWVQYPTISGEISNNLTTAPFNTLPVNPAELVTGEHSGLRDTNTGRVQGDNPNLVQAVNALGIKVIASDISKDPAPRMVGGAVTLPRYPNSLYYNVGTAAELVDEYNFIYTADNPSTAAVEGACVASSVNTCLTTPLAADGFTTYIAPLAAAQTFARMLDNDPRPHFVHQSNFAEERLAYTWLNSTLAKYRAAVASNMPILNPTMTESADVLAKQSSWNSIKGGITAYVKGGQVVITSPVAGWVPLTAVTGKVYGTSTDWGEAYAGTRSAWTWVQAQENVVIDARQSPPGAGVTPGLAPVPIAAPATNAAPVAAFTVSCSGLACAVDASRSSDPDGSVVSYQWSFGDGTGAAGARPAAHGYPRAGAYPITLTVFDDRGGSAASTQTVNVLPAPTIKVKAVSRAGKVKVDVDPNLKKKGYWRIQLQKLNKDGSWTTLKKSYKTQGKKETRTVNPKKGVYRVVSAPRPGFGVGYSGPVQLKR